MKFIAEPGTIAASNVASLREMAAGFPASAIVQMLYLKALHTNQSYQYQKQLTRTALVTPNRQRLFAFLNEEGVAGAPVMVDNSHTKPEVHDQQQLSTTVVSVREPQQNEPPVLEKISVEAPVMEPAETHEEVREQVLEKSLLDQEAAATAAVDPTALQEKPTADALSATRVSQDPTKQLDEKPETAAQVQEDGSVVFDLDRVDARTRAVIERSLALREKLALKKQQATLAADTASDQTTKQDAGAESQLAVKARIEEINQRSDTNTEEFTDPQVDTVEETAQHEQIELPEVAAEQQEDAIDATSHGEPITTQLERPIQNATEDELQGEKASTVSGLAPGVALPVGDMGSLGAAPNKQAAFEAQDQASVDYPELPLLVFNAQEIEPAPEGGTPLMEVTNPNLEPSITEEIGTEEVAEIEETQLTAAHTFFEWIQLVEKGTYKQPKVARQKEEKLKMIDSFLQKVPSLKPSKEALNQRSVATHKPINPAGELLMTETLANVYVAQKHYDKALAAFEILRLKYPEKSSYFADLISKVKKLKNSPE
jgi:hypothetical protein